MDPVIPERLGLKVSEGAGIESMALREVAQYYSGGLREVENPQNRGVVAKTSFQGGVVRQVSNYAIGPMRTPYV